MLEPVERAPAAAGPADRQGPESVLSYFNGLRRHFLQLNLERGAAS
jgi:hypothetical protein